MTVQEYHARNAEITKKIESLNAAANSYDQQATAYDQAAIQWVNQVGNRPGGSCGGTKKQKDACERDKSEKLASASANRELAKTARNNAANIRSVQIPTLQSEFNANIKRIEEAQKSADQVAKELASQGKTIESVKTEADYAGQANLSYQQTLAQADAAAKLKSAEADAANKKKVGFIVTGVVVLVLIVVAVVLFKKLKKKK